MRKTVRKQTKGKQMHIVVKSINLLLGVLSISRYNIWKKFNPVLMNKKINSKEFSHF